MARVVEEHLEFSHQTKLLISLVILIGLVANWLPHLDTLAQAYLFDTINSNAIVFAVVRTLNGVISVVQSAEVGIGVAGISIGEIFDPVNDLIERFSGLLLITLTALGIQQVILLFSVSLVLKIIFSVITLTTLLVLWTKPAYWAPLFRICLFIILLRFLLVAEVGFVWLFDWLYFDATGQQALSVLEASTRVVESIKETFTNIDLSDLIFGSDTPAITSEDLGSTITTSIVTLIVGMLFKSLFIPIGTLWLGFKSIGLLANKPSHIVIQGDKRID